MALACLALVATHAVGATNDTVLVSRASGVTGAKANHDSQDPSLGADGRLVVFSSTATNLDPADTDALRDIYVRDLVTDVTVLVSRASGSGGEKGNDGSFEPSISADGRFVAFSTRATNLGSPSPDEPGGIYVRDLANATTTLVSRASGPDGDSANGPSGSPATSGDGRLVAFSSSATNLDPDDGDPVHDIYVRDLATQTTRLVSRTSGESGPTGGDTSGEPAFSSDGRYIAFSSYAALVPGILDGRLSHIYVRDLAANTTLLASRATGANGKVGGLNSERPAISADGRRVAFESHAENLHPDDRETRSDVFVRDLRSNKTILASDVPNRLDAKDTAFRSPSISASGRIVSYVRDPDLTKETAATIMTADLAAGDTAVVPGVELVGSAQDVRPRISGDGRWLLFGATAGDLHPDDPDAILDIFARDLGAPSVGVISAKRRQTLTGLNVKAVCPEVACSVDASGEIAVSPDKSGRERKQKSRARFALRPVSAALNPGEARKMRLRRRRSERRKLGALLERRNARATASVTVHGTDAGGPGFTEKLKISLRRS